MYNLTHIEYKSYIYVFFSTFLLCVNSSPTHGGELTKLKRNLVNRKWMKHGVRTTREERVPRRYFFANTRVMKPSKEEMKGKSHSGIRSPTGSRRLPLNTGQETNKNYTIILL